MRAEHFLRVLEFMVTQGNHQKHAPAMQQGVQVILDGKALSFVAVDSCATTTVVMLPMGVSGGRGVFFIPFGDVDDILPALRHEKDVKVTVQRSEQPFMPGRACLKINIGDWSEHYLGVFKDAGLPKRSAVHSQHDLTSADIKIAANQLKALKGDVNQYAFTKVAENSYRIDIVNPSFGTKSVSKLIY